MLMLLLLSQFIMLWSHYSHELSNNATNQQTYSIQLSTLTSQQMKYANLSMELDHERYRRFAAKKRLLKYAEKMASMEISIARYSMANVPPSGHHDVGDELMDAANSQTQDQTEMDELES